MFRLREKVRFFSNSVVVVFDKGSTIRPFDKLRVVSLSNHKLMVVSEVEPQAHPPCLRP
jgi:hypothetical protein